MMLDLPTPDDFGNYWLTEGPGRAQGPAIFPSKKLAHAKRSDQESLIVNNGYFLASTGHSILWDSPSRRFQRFSSPQKALEALHELDALPG